MALLFDNDAMDRVLTTADAVEVVEDAFTQLAEDEAAILYDNISSGIQFAAVGDLVYEKVRAAGLGTEIPLSWFQQDIRD